jgi:hypothetical protein
VHLHLMYPVLAGSDQITASRTVISSTPSHIAPRVISYAHSVNQLNQDFDMTCCVLCQVVQVWPAVAAIVVEVIDVYSVVCWGNRHA